MAAAAGADGFFAPVIERVGQSPAMVASPRQEAVLATDGQTVQVVLRTHFRRGPKELAWVVPVPTKPTGVDKCDGRVFAVLETRTAPRFYSFSGGKKGLSCGCGAKGQSTGVATSGSVVVEASGTAGIFQYVVLSAAKADELTRWLNDHKYFVPVGAERIFQRYVQAGWHWLAMRVRPEAADEPTLAPHPIVYTYPDTKLVYPLVVSQLSADLKNEIVLYVVAGSRYACANWANATIETEKLRVQRGSPSGTNYERVFQGLCEAQQGRVFITEFAAAVRLFGYRGGRSSEINNVIGRSLIDALGLEQTVTRLRAVMPPGAMDRDVALKPSADSSPPVSNVHVVSVADRAGAALALAAPAAVFGLLWLGVSLTDRRGWAKAGSVVCLLVGCAALAML